MTALQIFGLIVAGLLLSLLLPWPGKPISWLAYLLERCVGWLVADNRRRVYLCDDGVRVRWYEEPRGTVLRTAEIGPRDTLWYFANHGGPYNSPADERCPYTPRPGHPWPSTRACRICARLSAPEPNCPECQGDGEVAEK